MAPNNGIKGGLSHSAQKKENAAAKKGDKPKGPAGDQAAKRSKVQCSLCKLVSQSAKELKSHFEAKHPKETFTEATHAIPVA